MIAQARANGFEFRKWYARHTARPWVSFEDAALWLSLGRRCFTLIFSHEFASCFWKSGTQITFSMPPKDFSRVLPDGTVKTIHRKAFTRRTARPDVWKYHLREMAGENEPLRYLRRYIRVEEDLDSEPDDISNGRPAPPED